jgi:hypothetical protein
MRLAAFLAAFLTRSSLSASEDRCSLSASEDGCSLSHQSIAAQLSLGHVARHGALGSSRVSRRRAAAVCVSALLAVEQLGGEDILAALAGAGRARWSAAGMRWRRHGGDMASCLGRTSAE